MQFRTEYSSESLAIMEICWLIQNYCMEIIGTVILLAIPEKMCKSISLVIFMANFTFTIMNG